MTVTLRKSFSGQAVVKLQLLLNRLLKLSPPLVPDGIFGATTEKAVKDFQDKNSLTVDGIVGPVTWSKLEAQAASAPYPILTHGERRIDVAHLQTMLNVALKLNPPMIVDGVFGSTTEKWVRSFQANVNIGIDGIVGPATWSALERFLVERVISVPKPKYSKKPPRWFAIAQSEVGQSEVKGQKHNLKIVKYHATTTLKAKTDEVPWCSSFINWVMIQAGYKGTNSAAAASWLNWGINTAARTGAITVIKNANVANSSLSTSGNHVGFLVKETEEHYILLGGNQSDQVKISYFPKRSWTLRGFRWPK